MPALVNKIPNPFDGTGITIRDGFKIATELAGTPKRFIFSGVIRAIDSRDSDIAPRYVHIANYWAPWEKKVLQVVAVATAAISVVMAVVTSYWFLRMSKRLRHSLIMFLITGDLFRAIWMLIISILALREGQVQSSSTVCQASGWFIQFGTIMNDWAALALAVHGAIQIIRPSVNAIHSVDVMFVYRHWIYAALIIIPVLCSSLGYVMENGHYTASGAFCMLPIRPLWYRLALSWIPRYIIGMTILGLTIAVYVHVRNVYKGTTRSRWWALSSIAVPKDDTETQTTQPSTEPLTAPRSSHIRDSITSHDAFDMLGLSTMDNAPSRRLSALTTAFGSTPAQTPKADQPISTQLSLDAPPSPAGGRRKSAVSMSTSSSSTGIPPRRIHSLDLPPKGHREPTTTTTPTKALPRRVSIRSNTKRNSSAQSIASNHTRSSKIGLTLPAVLSIPMPSQFHRSRAPSTPNVLRSQRAAIRRHLRLTFIYPLVYIAMWLCPFALHCMQYNNYFAAQPPFALGVLATCCYTLMAAVDCGIFAYREKPWRHIRRNIGGSFWGSFRIRRGGDDSNVDKGGKSSRWGVDGYGSGAWGSWAEKGGLGKGNKRTKRGDSMDSVMGVAPDVSISANTIDEESAIGPADISKPKPQPRSPASGAARPNTLATIDSNEAISQRHSSQESQTYLGGMAEIPRQLKRAVTTAPRRLSKQPGKVIRKLNQSRTLAKRSDAEKLASEHAQARLKVEKEERRAREEEKLATGAGWAQEVGSATYSDPTESGRLGERHWWDTARKDSEFTAWGGSRRGTVATNGIGADGSPSESDQASPGQSPSEVKEPVGWPCGSAEQAISPLSPSSPAVERSLGERM
ncbi:hypothetical protein NA57DRAFT_71884 [Rhizodiscina lignyota]|uniref:Uncharacterized protein n=1 Tax=Rhizodiscina lignyota TaxID=1504668 RepID=A0A9P4IPA3_9PEZI|nr:hypothetical protein NA57DRAFT_71884 [Rhizodiscina lignyota]